VPTFRRYLLCKFVKSLFAIERSIIPFSDMPTPLSNSDLTVALMGTVASDSGRLFRSFRGDVVSVAKSVAQRRLRFRKHIADSGQFAFFIRYYLTHEWLDRTLT
jgi:hypothetical protein